jgi:hypothetical protein
MKRNSLLLFFVLFTCQVTAQDDLMALLEQEEENTKQYVEATFKGARLVNGHSVKTQHKNVLEFLIMHRFGTINSGAEEFWGLDQANIRLGLEYGLTDNLNIGIGRSSFNKVIDAFLKYRALRQSNKAPVTITLFGSAVKNTNQDLPEEVTQQNRFSYTFQALIARKFNKNLSIQLSPTFIQRNLVSSEDDANQLIALGIGSRYKLSNRVSLNLEYYPQLTDYSEAFQNALAIGFDIETGGHVFQVHVTNAQQMNEPGFIGETMGDFFDGDVHYGFNISRVFDLKPKRPK